MRSTMTKPATSGHPVEEWQDDDRWLSRYSELVEFRQVHGHTNVSTDIHAVYRRLASWASSQRSNYGRLSPRQRGLLKGLGFRFNSAEEEEEEEDGGDGGQRLGGTNAFHSSRAVEKIILGRDITSLPFLPKEAELRDGQPGGSGSRGGTHCRKSSAATCSPSSSSLSQLKRGGAAPHEADDPANGKNRNKRMKTSSSNKATSHREGHQHPRCSLPMNITELLLGSRDQVMSAKRQKRLSSSSNSTNSQNTMNNTGSTTSNQKGDCSKKVRQASSTYSLYCVACLTSSRAVGHRRRHRHLITHWGWCLNLLSFLSYFLPLSPIQPPTNQIKPHQTLYQFFVDEESAGAYSSQTREGALAAAIAIPTTDDDGAGAAKTGLPPSAVVTPTTATKQSLAVCDIASSRSIPDEGTEPINPTPTQVDDEVEDATSKQERKYPIGTRVKKVSIIFRLSIGANVCKAKGSREYLKRAERSPTNPPTSYLFLSSIH